MGESFEAGCTAGTWERGARRTEFDRQIDYVIHVRRLGVNSFCCIQPPTSMAVDPDKIDRNLEIARQKKATGDVAFKSGNLPDGR